MPKSVKADFHSGLNIISSYLAGHKKEITTLSFLGILGAILGAVVPYLGGRIIDLILDDETINLGTYAVSSLFFFVFVFFAVRLVQEILGWQVNVKRDKLSGRLEAEYVTNNTSKIMDLPISFHKKHKIGDISNRINRGAGGMITIPERTIDIVPELLSIIFASVLIFRINVLLSSIIVFSVLLYVLFLVKTVPRIVPLEKRMHNIWSKSYGDAYDAMTNIQAVKQATAENHEKKKLRTGFLNLALRSWNKYVDIWQTLSLTQRIIITFTQLAIYLISFNFIGHGQMTIGELVMFNGYSALFFGPFVRLGHNWQGIQNAMINLIKADNLLKEVPERYQPEKITKVDDIKGKIEFKNVSFGYPDKKKRMILEDVDFEAKPGEVIALVGESGVGKTTLIDLISFYYRPTKGKVLIDGIDNRKLDLKFLRSRIAVVPQDITLFNDTVINNIKYGFFDATDQEVEWAAKMAHADHFIKTFSKKYEQLVGERGIKLSTGQRQRIALARAFLRKPRILILDEPTSALDARSESYVQDALQKLMQDKTTFIIAHRLSTVRQADKIIVFEKGRIAEIGRHEELLQKENGIYRNLYELQIGFFK